MSLEKFQATDAWRNKFKTHLFAERKNPLLQAGTTKTTTTTKEPQTPQRLSYQLSEDLQVILEEKKIPRPNLEMPRVRVRDAEEDDKENIKQFHERLHASTSNTPRKMKRQPNIDMTLMDGGSNDDLHITNTSFETLENMCEKTASDPNSTLFKYLRSGSPPSAVQQPQSTRAANRVPSYDEEADALQRLLDELNVEETEKRLKGIPTLTDDTQLDDIEAPSRFWENTMTPETLQSISPVKMVGLMRQSTIMEEYSDVSESEASSTSYQSAMKTGFSSETTGCYETANDTAAGSERGVVKKMSTASSERSSSSELFQQRHSRQKFFNDEKIEDKEGEEVEHILEDYIEKSINLMDFDLQREDDPLGESLQLMDFDTTVKCPPAEDENEQENELTSNSSSSPAKSLEELEEEYSLDPLKSSPESSPLASKVVEVEEEYSLQPLKSSPESSPTQLTTQSDESDSLIIELSDEESSMAACATESLDSENVMNRSFTIKSEEKPMATTNDEEKSLHFNDTMEEVEYMMNKGMQYMQAAAKDNHRPSENQNLLAANRKTHLTPVKKFDRYRSPSPMLSSAASSPLTPKTVILAKPKSVNKHVLDIKPFPKLDLFKKPQGSGLKPPSNRFTSSMKKQQYAHVVSPIGAYIKKTPTTPLISTIRPDVAGVSSPSLSKAFRKLDCDSRVVTPAMGSPRQLNQQQQQVRGGGGLPKKAYVSSELKHIVDDRTQYTIPGGPKIQRYLVSAMIPAVVRHEGKVKIPANLRTSDMQPTTSRRTDDSLADLSLASGDVSVYTIKDAQKF